MELGCFAMPSHPPECGLKEGHDFDLQVLRWLDELGYQEAWIGEHHTAPWSRTRRRTSCWRRRSCRPRTSASARRLHSCPIIIRPNWRTVWRCSTTSRAAG